VADPLFPGVAAVTFDFWNTLVYEERGHLHGRRLEAWAGILEDAGFAAERQELSAAFESAWEAYVASWTANQQFLAASAAEHCLERLGFRPPDDVKVALVDAFTNAGAGATLHLTEGVAATVAALKGAGLRLGIVCDVGMTPSRVLRAHLDGRGLLDAFDGWAFSDEVGVYKPDPAIFAAALEAIGGVPADATVHVGDLRRTDVAGAKAALMYAVRYRGVFDDDTLPGVEADAVIADHRDLPALVGVA
jgi:FMN phosphatase YigB (HAD superfamily)